MGKSKYVITVTRQFGSMGRPIARKMAEKLNISYYDRDLADQAAKKLNLPVSTVNEEEEYAEKKIQNPFEAMRFPLGFRTSSTQDQIFEAQKNIIKFLAEKETCIKDLKMDEAEAKSMIDSSLLGIDGTVALLKFAVEQAFGDKT